MDIDKTIEQLRSECIVMEEMARQFVERCVKARTALDKLSAPAVRIKKPVLSKAQSAQIRANVRKSFIKKVVQKIGK